MGVRYGKPCLMAVGFFVASVLAGCGSVPLGATYQEMIGVPADKAVVYFYRPSLPYEYGVVFDIQANGAPVVGLADGSYFPWVSAPGLVTFTSRRAGEKTSELPVNVEAGQSYYVQLMPAPGIFRYRPVLMLAHEEHARREIVGCRRVLR